MTIAKNIKTLREAHNLSQKEFAIIAGVSEQAVSSWETGVREPRMGPIQKIADHFGLKKSDIIDNKDLANTLVLDAGLTKDFAKLMAIKNEVNRNLKIDLIRDVIHFDLTEEQLKALLVLMRSIK